MSTVRAIAANGGNLSPAAVSEVIDQATRPLAWSGKKVLLIVPDATRTAPVGPVFRELHSQVAELCEAFDVMIALGTHPPMSDGAICERLAITSEERSSKFRNVRFFNHEWDNPDALRLIGAIPAAEIEALSGGLFSMDVPVSVNARLFEYDRVIIIGPVFPHEVVGCSGGNKYLFPGVAGPDILNFFHWLGAVITNPMIIGNKWTPVRKVVDRAAALVGLEKLCFCLVVSGSHFSGIFAGTPEEAWDEASDLSQELHIVRKPHPFHTVLSCAPLMYDELWVGGKCMYKLEPVVADGGELIIYAPHIHEISLVHGHVIRELGYHCRDYFLKQWDQFKNYPWGTIAHSTHVRGIGTFEDGVEHCRIQVTLATGIPEDVCRQINLGYRDPASINKDDFANREDDGILLVPKAGEMLYHLDDRPDWARET
ncbi:MAG: lactate racemase domain-containing protein [Terrimicrobiaceae bacterium]|nr:lactate racemase domain-containing protein [Terrimicrobiaceae bacterium]